MTLDKDRGYGWVETNSEQCCCEFKSSSAQHIGRVGHGERMKIDYSVIDVCLMLASDPVSKRTQIIAKVDLARGLDAGKDPSHVPTLVERHQKKAVN